MLKIDLTATEKADLLDFVGWLRKIRDDSNYGEILIVLEHGDMTEVRLTVRKKPQLERKDQK